jgi:hypothetical protein
MSKLGDLLETGVIQWVPIIWFTQFSFVLGLSWFFNLIFFKNKKSCLLILLNYNNPYFRFSRIAMALAIGHVNILLNQQHIFLHILWVLRIEARFQITVWLVAGKQRFLSLFMPLGLGVAMVDGIAHDNLSVSSPGDLGRTLLYTLLTMDTM